MRGFKVRSTQILTALTLALAWPLPSWASWQNGMYVPAANAFGPYGGGYGGGAYGQWGGSGGTPYVDMTPVYVSNVFNWSGAQPMGYSYLPPMGLGAISNSLVFGRAFGAR